MSMSSSFPAHLSFETVSLIEPGAHQFGYADLSMISEDLPISVSPALE